MSESARPPGGSPENSANHRPNHVPMLVTGAGGTLTLIAFLALPQFTFPLVGGVTMPATINLLSLMQPEWRYLWLIAVAAAFVAGCGIWLGCSSNVGTAMRLRATGAIETVSFLVGLVYVLLPFSLTDDQTISADTSAQIVTSFLAIGYYLAAIGMIAAFIAAAIAARELRHRRRVA